MIRKKGNRSVASDCRKKEFHDKWNSLFSYQLGKRKFEMEEKVKNSGKIMRTGVTIEPEWNIGAKTDSSHNQTATFVLSVTFPIGCGIL